VTRLQKDVPAHKALHCHINWLSVDYSITSGSVIWTENWINEVRKDSRVLPANLLEACDQSRSPQSDATTLAASVVMTMTDDILNV